MGTQNVVEAELMLGQVEAALNAAVDSDYAKRTVTSNASSNTSVNQQNATGSSLEEISLLRRIAEAVNSGERTVNLVLPDGTKLASYLFNPLASYAKANGTPIINPST
jgi:hypothetical protein